MKLISTILLTLFVSLTYGQTFSEDIDGIYNFKPAKLSDKEQEAKLPALDKFWDKVKGDTAKYLPQLRYELGQDKHNPFFYYDGSTLLLSLSKAITDKELAVKAIARCDLDDISQKAFVTMLSRLAHEGIDVTPAAIKILNDDEFSFFIPQHSMTFNQGYCLTYMLLPQKTNGYIDTLISKFPTVSTVSKKSIITTLWFAYSCKGDEFLRSIMGNQSTEKEVSDYAKRIMGYTKLTKDQKEYLKTIGKEHLEEIREMSLQRFSDEAIAELDMTTRVLRTDKNCQ
jgi:hypothetical protein